jgi:heat shock protein HtpX
VTTEPPPLVSDHDVRANRRRAATTCALGAVSPSLVVGVVLGLAVSTLAGVIGAAGLFVLLMVSIPRIATRIALLVIGARPLGDDELPRLQNLVDGLCPTFGLRRPTLMALDEALPNACSVGSGPDHGVLVVTTGLEAVLDLIELEGVVAHELSHLKRSDVVVSSVAVAVLAPFIWISGSDRLLHRVLGTGRELLADKVAVRAVRYPPGLCAALEKFEAMGEPEAGSLFARRRLAMSRWLWIDPAVGRRGEHALGDLDLTSVRVGALAEA